MSDSPKYPQVKVQLTGQDGNAFAIIGRCRAEAKKTGLSREKLDEFFREATSGDYDHLLMVCMKWFDCK